MTPEQISDLASSTGGFDRVGINDGEVWVCNDFDFDYDHEEAHDAADRERERMTECLESVGLEWAEVESDNDSVSGRIRPVEKKVAAVTSYLDDPHYQSFVRYCAEDPDDDQRRLVAADAMAEWPDAASHAELIRLQMALKDAPKSVAEITAANATVIGYCSRHADNMGCDCLSLAEPWEALRARERELLAAMGYSCRAENGIIQSGTWNLLGGSSMFGSNTFFADVRFSRGMPEWMSMSAADWLRWREGLRACYVVRDVKLRTEAFDVIDLLSPDWRSALAGLRSAVFVVGRPPMNGEWLQECIVDGCRVTVRYERPQTITLPPGRHVLDRPIVVQPGQRIDGNDATLIGSFGSAPPVNDPTRR